MQRNKRLLMILLSVMLILVIFGMVACNDRTEEEEEDPDPITPQPNNEMSFSQYMSKINSGLKAGETELNTLTDYYVQSMVELITSEENLTITYKAIYAKNRRLGKYYIRIFDNVNHIDRLVLYYDSNDLYLTVRDIHYVVKDFSSYMLFDAFVYLLDVVDIGEYVYGEEMQTYFQEKTILAQIISINSLSYNKSGTKGENITISKGDVSVIMGVANDAIVALSKIVGESFDTVVNHYLGFRLSKLITMKFGSIIVDNLSFLLNSGTLVNTDLKINGRMQDNSKYFLNLDYKYSVGEDEIAEAKDLPKKFIYTPFTPGQGAFDGNVTVKDMRDTAFDLGLDFDIHSSNNNLNEIAMRIYDQNNTAATQETKYDNINEIIGVYYDEGLLFINTEGAYDYLSSAVSLNALNMPKIYMKGLNITGLMTLGYNNILQTTAMIFDAEERTASVDNKRKSEAVMNALESDVSKQEISFTITETLFKEMYGNDVSISSFLASQLNMDEDVLYRYVSRDFFENLTIVLRYNFGTKYFTVEFYEGTKLLVVAKFTKCKYFGVSFPYDLNELDYAQFKQPDVVTMDFIAKIDPYGTDRVDLSGFFGAFIGDSSGKNTPYKMETGQYLKIAGMMSEYYITNAVGERTPITTMNLDFYVVDAKKTDRWMSVVTNPANTEEFLVTMYKAVGDYDGSGGEIKYKIARSAVAEAVNAITGTASVLFSNAAVSAFLSAYNNAKDNSKAYFENGYYCLSLVVTEDKDPVEEMLGISDTNAIIKSKISFLSLDLSAVNIDAYSTPYIHTGEDVSAKSIYSSGSKWKETVAVGVSDKRINLKTTYDKGSITIVTGKNEYHPVAYIFGLEFSYTLYITTVTGTYKVINIELDGLENDMMIIDPAFTDVVPRQVNVMFEGGEKGTLECEVEGFPDYRVTCDGYNLALLAGKPEGVKTNKLVIGKNSIASIEKDIYVTVINRQVIPVKNSNNADEYYVTSGEQIPVVASFVEDPYKYAMMTKIYADRKTTYDYLGTELMTANVELRFNNIYGYETKIDPETEEEYEEALYYDEEGFNKLDLAGLSLDWDFSTAEFSWQGGTRYAVAVYGDPTCENSIKIAIKVEIMRKEISGVVIDTNADGTYSIDTLVRSTYSIPTQTTNDHTVVIKFKDGTTRKISTMRPPLITDNEYATNYIYGELNWVGTEGLTGLLSLEGSSGLFGEGISKSNTTTAVFGREITKNTQTVPLMVLVPRRKTLPKDSDSTSLVTEISSEGVMTKSQTTILSTARFTKPNVLTDLTKIESLGLNPYDAEAYLPETIWLNVFTTMATSATSPKMWKEYPVRWVTTDDNTSNPKELNIIKKRDNR